MRAIIAVVSDFQSGSALGLAHPKTLLSRWDDEAGEAYEVPISLNPAQEYLYEIYEHGLKETLKLAGGSPLHVIVNGDMTQGDRFLEELSHPLIADQTTMAVDLISEWLRAKSLKSIRLTKSTRVHAYHDGQADTIVAREVRARHKNTRLVGHGLMSVSGVLIDYAHHGPPAGVRSWLKGNLMRYNVRSIVDTAIKDREPIPQVILRAHKHERVEEWVTDWRGDERIRVVGITTPSFQLMTSHAQKATNSEPKVTNGMVAIEVEDGLVKDIHWFAKTRRMPRMERM